MESVKKETVQQIFNLAVAVSAWSRCCEERSHYDLHLEWQKETFLVLAPQLDRRYGGWQNLVHRRDDQLRQKNLRIDENRIFLTGLSLGGGGTWAYAGRFAGQCPETCGHRRMLRYLQLAHSGPIITNANLPVWAFHAMDDSTVGASCTTNTINSINDTTIPR